MVLAVGLATIACGFLAGALLNVYFWLVQEPLAQQFRTTLTYPSAIVGDGLVLPLVNMAATAFLLQERAWWTRKMFSGALLLGLGVTLAFHVDQAVNGIVNWSMPTPWHWNLLGAYHAAYMLAVAALLGAFLLSVVGATRRTGRLPGAAGWVALGGLVFFGLLRMDYLVR